MVFGSLKKAMDIVHCPLDKSLFIPHPHLPHPPLHRTPRLPPPGQSGPPPPLHLPQAHLLLPRPPRPQKSPQGRRSPHLPPPEGLLLLLLRAPPPPPPEGILLLLLLLL